MKQLNSETLSIRFTYLYIQSIFIWGNNFAVSFFIYSRASVARTLIARLSRLSRSRSWIPMVSYMRLLFGKISAFIFSRCYFHYAPAYSKNSGRALSVTPVRPVRLSVRLSVRPSVRPYVLLSCPGHNSKTLWNIFMKLHRCIHHNKTMCHEQGRQLLHFWFLNYFPLT